jgi:hypothetical protein
MVSSFDPTLEAPPSRPISFPGWDGARSSRALDDELILLEEEGLVGIEDVTSLPLESHVLFPRDGRTEDDLGASLPLRLADRAADAASDGVVLVVIVVVVAAILLLGDVSDPDDAPREMLIRYDDEPYDGNFVSGGRGVVGTLPLLLHRR